MANYRHILLAADLSPAGELVWEKAASLAGNQAAKLTVLHVVESIPMDLTNELMAPQLQDLETQLAEQAQKKLEHLKERHRATAAEHLVTVGSTTSEILRFTAENQVDLIIVGSRGRGGLLRLLGSTANSVLYHAPCDVLAIRIGTI